jgi:hypothetical protein
LAYLQQPLMVFADLCQSMFGLANVNPISLPRKVSISHQYYYKFGLRKRMSLGFVLIEICEIFAGLGGRDPEGMGQQRFPDFLRRPG